jgi:two-component system nitrogen regulation response regulator GlnG
VLLDIGLPGISGIEALVKIKRRYPDMIVIMMSAYDDEKIIVYAMSLGAYDYLVKPLQMVILIEIVHKALWKTTK